MYTHERVNFFASIHGKHIKIPPLKSFGCYQIVKDVCGLTLFA